MCLNRVMKETRKKKKRLYNLDNKNTNPNSSMVNPTIVEDAFFSDDHYSVLSKLPSSSEEYLFYKCLHLLHTTPEPSAEEKELLKTLNEHTGPNASKLLDQFELRSLFLRWDTLELNNKKQLLEELRQLKPFAKSTRQPKYRKQRSKGPSSQPQSSITSSSTAEYPSEFTFSARSSIDQTVARSEFILLNPPAFNSAFSQLKKSQHAKFFDQLRSRITPAAFDNPITAYKALMKTHSSTHFGADFTKDELQSLLNHPDHYSVYTDHFVKKTYPGDRASFSQLTVFYDKLLKFALTLRDSSQKSRLIVTYLAFQLKRDASKVTGSLVVKAIKCSIKYGFSYSHLIIPTPDYNHVVDDCLRVLFSTPTCPSPYDFYGWEEARVLRLYAETRLVRDLPIRPKYLSNITSEFTTEVMSRVVCKFDSDTPREYLTGESVALIKFSYQNTFVRVKVFELDLVDLYFFSNDEESTGLNLDGLFPSFEQLFEKPSSNLLHSTSLVIDLIGKCKRGAFIVDLESTGSSERILVKKGCMSIFSQEDSSGTLIGVVDETGKLVKDAELYCDDVKLVNQSKFPGLFQAPETETSKQCKIIGIYDDFAVKKEIQLSPPNFNLSVKSFIGQDQIVLNSSSSIFVSPSFLRNEDLVTESGCFVSAECSLSVTNTSDATSVFSKELEMKDLNNCFIFDFSTGSVPIKEISVTINVELKIGKQKRQLTETDHHYFNTEPNDLGILSFVLTPNSTDFSKFCLRVIGKGGEPLPKKVCAITCMYSSTRECDSITCMSDDQGVINIENEGGVIELNVACGNYSKNFELFPVDNRSTFHTFSSPQVSLLLPGTKTSWARARIVQTDKSFDNAVSRVKNFQISQSSDLSPCYLSATLPSGCYKIDCFPNDCPLVSTPITTMKVIVLPELLDDGLYKSEVVNSVGVLKEHDVPVISDVKLTNGNLSFNIEDSSTSSIFIYSSPFMTTLDESSLSHDLSSTSLHPIPRASFVSDPVTRSESEELQYIRQRHLEKPSIGCFFSTPSLLLAPRKKETSKTKAQDFHKGSSYGDIRPMRSEAAHSYRNQQGGGFDSGPSKMEVLPWIKEVGHWTEISEGDIEDGGVVVKVNPNHCYFRLLIVSNGQTFQIQVPRPLSSFITTSTVSTTELSPLTLEKASVTVQNAHDSHSKESLIISNHSELFSVLISGLRIQQLVLKDYAFISDWFSFDLSKKLALFLSFSLRNYVYSCFYKIVNSLTVMC
ncbi:hypothetical protein GEMRC1_007522 [Eukaryota sp. GEM-RC1]